MGRFLLASLPESASDAELAASELAHLTDRTVTDTAVLHDELTRVREQGWSLVDGELEPGLRSIAAPVHARDGSVVAALNVSTSATRDSVEHVRNTYLPPLLRTAAAIDAELRLV
jgi:IclR family transcriptional regulator, pca regulon regulatory protein